MYVLLSPGGKGGGGGGGARGWVDEWEGKVEGEGGLRAFQLLGI